jgi:hypothetical protein
MGPEKEKQRRLAEADIDPGGDVTSDNSGQTEQPAGGRRSGNQPAENQEDPSRDRDAGNRDSENAPKPGHQE